MKKALLSIVVCALVIACFAAQSRASARPGEEALKSNTQKVEQLEAQALR